jgi:hypothetical protein
MRSISSSKTSGGKIPSCMWVQNNYSPASESTYYQFNGYGNETIRSPSSRCRRACDPQYWRGGGAPALNPRALRGHCVPPDPVLSNLWRTWLSIAWWVAKRARAAPFLLCLLMLQKCAFPYFWPTSATPDGRGLGRCRRPGQRCVRRAGLRPASGHPMIMGSRRPPPRRRCRAARGTALAV